MLAAVDHTVKIHGFDTASSLGSPGSPPSSPLSCHSYGTTKSTYNSTPLPNNSDVILGIDSDAITAELDMKYEFEYESGKRLEGKELELHLKKSNSKLAMKVKYFRSENEQLLLSELQVCKNTCNYSVDHVRFF